ncbi:HlyD family type I secretion periplasmic adaptor subunit [Neisseria shayeganii]|uniref:Membrane fusion protein (MFP) family protein n=1 Tax=Neisseria shayeganii TaxID=607712 RepID=A0A7D7NGN2_9NEIS|nr:HlyD family type I secretion periplasmic adaptor subunit [Neisseria shayeganii]QMT40974.1 HlyD family type I secretion periplasmic adaptor subunit [Neisseria shayeganii]
MSFRLQAFRDLWRRYAAVWRSVWPLRFQLDPPKRSEDELAFLPAHLELTETPLSAAPKWAARFIMLFALLALAWALIGKMDIVAVAQGKTAPDGRSKTIQSLETALVRKIAVADGEHVQAGQVLAELEGVGSESDAVQSQQALQAARLNTLRLQAVLAAVASGQPPRLDRQQAAQWQLGDEAVTAAEVLAANQYQAWYTQDAQLQTELRAREAEARAVQAQADKLAQMTAIEARRTADFKELLAKNFISQHAYYEQEGKWIQSRHDLASERNRLQQIREQMRQVAQSRQLNTQTLERDTRDALRQAEEQAEQLAGQAERAGQRRRLMTLTAPVDGTVQQLAAHTVGGVVTAAQPIMVVVPDEERMEVEVMVPNKDIGFVRSGQDVVVKIESFPYTRYGYLTGKVASVGLDAVAHEQLGLVFPARITLDEHQLVVDGRPVKLTGGMNITAEIKTGRRRVIDYLLSPLQTKVDESLKER